MVTSVSRIQDKLRILIVDDSYDSILNTSYVKCNLAPDYIAATIISTAIRNGSSLIEVDRSLSYEVISLLEYYLKGGTDDNVAGFFGGSPYDYKKLLQQNGFSVKDDSHIPIFGQALNMVSILEDEVMYLQKNIIPHQYLPELVLTEDYRVIKLVSRI